MTLQLKPTHPLFGAEASGVDLRQPDPAMVRAIDAAMNEYGVLVFRGQPLTEEQQLDLARAFGPLDFGFKTVNTKVANPQQRLKHVELADISNVGVDEQVTARDHRKVIGNIANQLWHSDSSFQKPAARYSMLHAVTLPARGGNTEFADMRAAYDALPQWHKDELEGLEAEHYALHSRFMLGDTDYTEEQKNAIPPVHWPVVRTHAGSGRKLLFIGVHARSIVGWTVAEGRILLMDLLEHATQREFVYRHEWREGDLVIWDNRCVLHRGRRFDLSQRRELRRATTLDADAEAPTAGAA